MDAAKPAERRDWPFLVVVWVVIAGTAAVAAWRDPSLRAPAPASLLAALATLHAALHGAFFLHAGTRARAGLYLLAQGALALGIGVVTRAPVVTLALCLALIGEAVGALPRRRAAVASALLFALFGAHAIVSGDDPEPAALLGAGVLTLLFVVVYVELMRRESRAREDAQAALAELHAAHQTLAEYAAKVEELTLAAERQRIARELHDTLAQGLAGVILQLGALEAHLGRGDTARAQAIVRQALERARAALGEARRAIDDLRTAPPASLADHARDEARRFTLATGIECTVDVDERLNVAPGAIAHLERCISEGLANVARHAHATHARVRALARDGMAVVEIEDDGMGFDPSAAEGQAGHYGLVGLRERARLAGGRLEVRSERGQGTRLRLTVPLWEAS